MMGAAKNNLTSPSVYKKSLDRIPGTNVKGVAINKASACFLCEMLCEVALKRYALFAAEHDRQEQRQD